MGVNTLAPSSPLPRLPLPPQLPWPVAQPVVLRVCILSQVSLSLASPTPLWYNALLSLNASHDPDYKRGTVVLLSTFLAFSLFLAYILCKDRTPCS